MNTSNKISKDTHHLPLQTLLKGEYIKIAKFHKNLDYLSVIPHRHDHYELILVLEGNGEHSINFNSYEIKPDRLFFIDTGKIHQINDFDRDGWLILFGEEIRNRFLQIHPQQNEAGLLNSFSSNPYIELDETLKKIFLLIVEQVQTELSEEKQDANILLHYISLFLLHANKAHIKQHPKDQLNPMNRQEFLRIKELIDVHYKEQHQSSFYAALLHMDIKKVNKICRQSTGMTLFGILQEKILTESKILLQTSSESIKEISYKMGFNDPAFFGRFFRKHTGITPLTFRENRSV